MVTIHPKRSISVLVYFLLMVFALLKPSSASTPPDAIPDMLVSFGPQTGSRYAVVVETSSQTLRLFSFDGTVKEVLQFRCSTGEAPGPKTRSGDSKTPEGVYFFTKEFAKRNLAPIYGSRAFPMDYPNIMDRLAGRDGNAIWLHGTNKPIKARDSNGCVVLENTHIDTLADYITLNRTPIIILDRITYRSKDSVLSTEKAVHLFLSDWNRAIQQGTYHHYLRFYAPAYLPDISWWPHWYRLHHGRQSEDPLPLPGYDQVSIYRLNDLYVVLFDQWVQSPQGKIPVGTRKLVIEKEEGAFRIVGDEFQVPSDVEKTAPAQHPLLAAYQNLIVAPEAGSGIEDMIDGWLKAWASKDIEKYGNYYASGFHSQGMDRRAWLRYKDQLNHKYKFIQVSQENLVIEKEGKDKSVATFLQTYRSPDYKAVGVKQLVLVRENGQWKIYRETWKKR